MCGRILRVTGPLGTVDVRVVDLCPSCAAGELDLNAPAFAAIANPLAGRVAVQWHVVPDEDPGTIFLQLVTGGNPFFLQIQPLYFRYGIASLEYLGPSGYVAARSEPYNILPGAQPHWCSMWHAKAKCSSGCTTPAGAACERCCGSASLPAGIWQHGSSTTMRGGRSRPACTSAGSSLVRKWTRSRS